MRYTDPDLRPAVHPGEISTEARARVRQMLRGALRPSGEAMDIWFGRFMTEPKPWLRPPPPARRTTVAALKARLVKGQRLGWHPAARVAWFASRQACHLFVDGQHHPLPERLTGFAALVGDRREFEAAKLVRLADNPQLGGLLLAWLDAGLLRWLK